MEVVLLRQNSIENRLKTLFTEGDENGDGVLSFEEFNRIVIRCEHYRITAAPTLEEVLFRRLRQVNVECTVGGGETTPVGTRNNWCNQQSC